ncbi:hypothetical protein AYO21_01401 [Fonsecaea monophora]|uniref:Carboxylic ester hydrolase n=1 Tax=Fonsecaea monophora TaxID=254056 RepID=A0A177FJM8_9EURO|nr:hypothetical protein AYO21_01401 [Fonsecaea monophora]OAG44405.1 hypothetical protein AYO21_01401 [Fonsecaea monophora]
MTKIISPSASYGPYLGAEDCLYVDIWVPTNSTADEKLPVLVEIPGGGYVETSFAAGADVVSLTEAVVYVFIHYRVNIFGFLSTTGLSQETSPYLSSGNYGLADWTLGLQWVHDNIDLFGGDPNRVTVHGSSAGAWAMSLVQVTPKTKGLFQQIMVESGGSDQSITVSSLEKKEVLGQTLASAAGCPWNETSDPDYALQNACLRNASIIDLMEAFIPQDTFLWYDEHALFPAPDGWWLPDYPQTLYDSGAFHQVPILAGSAMDEMNLIQFLPYLNVSGQWLYNATAWEDVAGWCKNFTSKCGVNVSATGALNDYYLDPNRTFDVRVNRNSTDGVGTNMGPYAAMVEISSGVIFQCPVRRNLRHQASAGQPAFGYTFGYRSPNAAGGVAAFAEHGSQLGLGFDPLAPYLTNTRDEFIAHTMQQYWASFVINGYPNNFTGIDFSFGVNQTLPRWPSQTEAGDTVLRIGNHDVMQDSTIDTVTGAYAYCDLQDAVIPSYTYRPNCAPGYSLTNDFKGCA